MHKTATAIGLFGVLLWTFNALFVALLSNIPIAQIITVTLGICFILGIIKITYQQRWHQMKQPAIIWFFGIIGIIGNNFAYIGATKYAPIDQVSLIVALSPVFLILLATFVSKEAFKIKYLLSAGIGLLAIYILVTQKNDMSALQVEFIGGYILALFAAIAWASYTLSLRYYKAPIDMIGLFCGVGSVLAALIHLNFETTVIPTGEQWLVLCTLGTFMLWLAYYLWAFGIMHGDMRLLSICLYAVPVFSIVWLVLFNKSTATPSMAIAVTLVVSASLLARPSSKKSIEPSKEPMKSND